MGREGRELLKKVGGQEETWIEEGRKERERETLIRREIVVWI